MTASAGAARDRRTRRLLEGPIAPTLLALAAGNTPFVIGQVGAQIAEAWYIGQLGVEALASVALVYPVMLMMQMTSAGAMGGAVNSAVARALGAGAPDRAASLALHACLIALSGAGVFMVAMLGFGGAVVDFFGASERTRGDALAYAGIVFLGAPTVWLSNTLASVARGAGAMAAAARALLLAFAIQIALGGALTFGLGPFPELGVLGAAYGHLIGFAVSTAVLATYLLSGRAGLTFDFGRFRFSAGEFWDILRVGLVAVLSPTLTVATVMIVTGLVAGHGAEALAGYGLGARLELMMVPLVFGIGTAATAMVGVNVGAGQWRRARLVALTAGGLAACLTGAVGLTAAFAPGLWLNLFTADPAAYAAGAAYLGVAGPAYVFLGFGLAVYFASLGARQAVWPTVGVAARVAIVGLGGLFVAGQGIEATFLLIAIAIAAFGAINAASLLAPGWRGRRL